MKSIVGKLIGDRYFILRETSRERSVALYLARDRSKSEPTLCQIERLHFSLQSNVSNFQSWQNLAKVFQTEAIALEKLGQHPQIPLLLDYFIEDREFYLVTQLAAGESLKERVREKRLTETEATFWLQSTLEALEFVHQKQILHLNIKPENLVRKGSESQISLMNFGNIRNSLELFYWYKQAEADNWFDDDYLPLEQREGNPNPTSDLYALGKTIIYALTGEVPKLRSTSSVNYQKPLLAEISDRVRVDISYKLNKILSKMIEENSAARYQSAAEVLADLQQNENIVALPLPFTALSQEERPVSRKKSIQSQLKFGKKIWFWSLLSAPFVVAMIIFFIGIDRNLYRNFASYTNSNYYLTIKYPQDWSLRELEDPITGEIVVFASPLENDSDPFREKVYISIEYLILNSLTLDEYLQTIIERIEQEGNQIEGAPQKTQLDSNPAITIVYSRIDEGLRLKQRETFAVINNRVYIVTYVAEATKYDKFLRPVLKAIESLNIDSQFYNIE